MPVCIWGWWPGRAARDLSVRVAIIPSGDCGCRWGKCARSSTMLARDHSQNKSGKQSGFGIAAREALLAIKTWAGTAEAQHTSLDISSAHPGRAVPAHAEDDGARRGRFSVEPRGAAVPSRIGRTIGSSASGRRLIAFHHAPVRFTESLPTASQEEAANER
jgi:hypothetical protein